VFQRLLNGDPLEMARRAMRTESRTNLLFSFEKMALRDDAVRGRPDAARFTQALYALLHGDGSVEKRFDDWCEALAKLPRRQTRVLTGRWQPFSVSSHSRASISSSSLW
jgi:hypothetical protein